MIFKDILKSKGLPLSKEFDNLLQVAYSTQKHKGDLLLIYINGFYQPEIEEWNKSPNVKEKLNPHVIGIGVEGHSEQSHYSFIHKYRTTHISELDSVEYLKKFEWSQDRKTEIDELIEAEETTIQLEMLVYLKIWEADMIIKKFYELVKLLHGESYDWYFRISNSARDNNATGSRQDIWRLKIRDRLANISPPIYNLLKDTYSTQIRNAIAHSNYSFQDRSIQLLNFIKDDPASQLKSITFEKWTEIFHNTLLLHNEYISINNQINDFYGDIAMKNKGILEILITEKNGKQYELPLEFRLKYKDWHYLQ